MIALPWATSIPRVPIYASPEKRAVGASVDGISFRNAAMSPSATSKAPLTRTRPKSLQASFDIGQALCTLCCVLRNTSRRRGRVSGRATRIERRNDDGRMAPVGSISTDPLLPRRRAMRSPLGRRHGDFVSCADAARLDRSRFPSSESDRPNARPSTTRPLRAVNRAVAGRSILIRLVGRRDRVRRRPQHDRFDDIDQRAKGFAVVQSVSSPRLADRLTIANCVEPIGATS